MKGEINMQRVLKAYNETVQSIQQYELMKEEIFLRNFDPKDRTAIEKQELNLKKEDGKYRYLCSIVNTLKARKAVLEYALKGLLEGKIVENDELIEDVLKGCFFEEDEQEVEEEIKEN